jgi:hypothetical protein
MGIDEPIERRRGERISAKGIYCDPVRSSHAHVVKASGLRWVCLLGLARIRWVDRVWALAFLTGRAPSARYYQVQGRQPQSLLHRAQQMVRLVRRWVPSRELVVGGDSPDAAFEWLAAVRGSARVITRLRLDAALDTPGSPGLAYISPAFERRLQDRFLAGFRLNQESVMLRFGREHVLELIEPGDQP